MNQWDGYVYGVTGIYCYCPGEQGDGDRSPKFAAQNIPFLEGRNSRNPETELGLLP